MQKIILFGATGLIGKELFFKLQKLGYNVVAVSRNKQKASALFGANCIEWNGSDASIKNEIEGAFAIINLAGESIVKALLTQKGRDGIVKSRREYATNIVNAVLQCKNKPQVFLQGAGVGYYEPFGNEGLDESSPNGKGFVCELSKLMETVTYPLKNELRLVQLRTGVVLSEKGGMLPLISLPFKLFLGGPLGKGQNYFPYISLNDEVNAIIHLLTSKVSGPVNLVNPNSIKMNDFLKQLAKKMNRPYWLPVPQFLLDFLLTKYYKQLILSNLQIKPKVLLQDGFKFTNNLY